MEAKYLGGANDFSFLHSMETGSGTKPASYPMGIGDYFPIDVKKTSHLHLVLRLRMVEL
jgi:hypothetical protein